MTNKLLSDEELRGQIDSWSYGKYSDRVNELLDLINTQKRLYAESVIGEDENNPAPREPCGASYRNQLRAEQRARINQ